MADIAHRIKLYNQAFQLAHEHIAKDDIKIARPNSVKALHDLIRREIAVGIDDPVSIAATAVRELEASNRVPVVEQDRLSLDQVAPRTRFAFAMGRGRHAKHAG